jgi:DNA-binding response OmpR family regulator
LLVEDQEHVRRYVALVLTGLGYRVLEADSGAAALAVAAAHKGPLDLLLTDVVMPGINGRALAEQMTVQYPAIRVLYMSGHSDDIADRHGVLQNGGSYLQKPFGAEALGQKVREVLSRGAKAAG